MKKKLGIALLLCLTIFATGCGCEKKTEEKPVDKKAEIKEEVKNDVVDKMNQVTEKKNTQEILDMLPKNTEIYSTFARVVQNQNPKLTNEMYQAYLDVREDVQYEVEEHNNQYFLAFTGTTVDLLSVINQGGYTDLESFKAVLSKQPKNKGGVLIQLKKENEKWVIDGNDPKIEMILYGGMSQQPTA